MTTTPIIDTCDLGHTFAKLPDHPTLDGRARCPHCMAIGLDQARNYDWRWDAYAKLGMVRDNMPPEHVGVVQNFLGPLE